MTYTEKDFVYDAIHNTTAHKLRYMPYAQANWDVTTWHDGTETWGMTSYTSRIFTASKEGGRVYRVSVQGARAAINYSRTTSRQVTAAMRELGLSDNEIAALKKFFVNGGEIAIAAHDSMHWVNGDTMEVIY